MPRSVLRCVQITALSALTLSLQPGIPYAALPQALYDDENSAEGWAWSKIKKGEWADFNQRCDEGKLPLDIRITDERWLDDCRKLKISFVRDVLTNKSLRELTPYACVRVKGARLVGDSVNPAENALDLENADLKRAIELVDDKMEGAVTLRRAKTDFFISLNSSLIEGPLDAQGLRSSIDLSLIGSIFAKEVNFIGAKVGGKVDLTGSRFDGGVSAESISIGTGLEAQFAKFGGNVDISLANVSGPVNLSDAWFDSTLSAYAIRSGGPVDLRYGHFGAVYLGFAEIPGPLDISDSSFYGRFDAYRFHVEGYVNARNAAFRNVVNMAFAKIENNLNLTETLIQNLDLSGASIGDELQFGVENEDVKWCPTNNKEKNVEKNDVSWCPSTDQNGEVKPQSVIVRLRNARIGTLTDTQDSWPDWGKIELSGITIDHLGGTIGEKGEKMVTRGPQWWDEQWARRNNNDEYTPAPYSQLAAVFSSMGDREDADGIRYLARERERSAAWPEHKWRYFFLTALKWSVGYGIGLYAFRVVYWVLGLSAVGAAILWWTVPMAAKTYKDKGEWRSGLTWCFGASLSRLLPIIELKEFDGFFNHPKKTGLALWQSIAFSFLGLAGWILGGVLILAVSGLNSPLTKSGSADSLRLCSLRQGDRRWRWGGLRGFRAT